MSETGKDSIFDRIGRFVAKGLNMEKSGYVPFTPSDLKTMREILRPGDVVLVEGNRQVSSAIKYLTQSTWSHAAMYVGDSVSVPIDQNDDPEDRPCLVEVNLGEGCVAVPLSKYETYNTRICRPVSLSDEDTEEVIQYAISRIGTQYDHSNIFDMLRYFFPVPFPAPIRRRMISLGSGDPSRAICSTLIAQAFQEVGYPILPVFEDVDSQDCAKGHCHSEVMHIRHHSLFAPRDFDLSPYFEVVKPTLVKGFDNKSMVWIGEVATIDPLNKRHTRKAAENAAEDENATP